MELVHLAKLNFARFSKSATEEAVESDQSPMQEEDKEPSYDSSGSESDSENYRRPLQISPSNWTNSNNSNGSSLFDEYKLYSVASNARLIAVANSRESVYVFKKPSAVSGHGERVYQIDTSSFYEGEYVTFVGWINLHYVSKPVQQQQQQQQQQRRQLELQKERFVLVVGTSEGFVRFYTYRGDLIFSNLFHSAPVINIRISAPYFETGVYWEMLVVYSRIVVHVDGKSLALFLHNQIAQIKSQQKSTQSTAVQQSQSQSQPPKKPFVYQKWLLEDQNKVNDALSFYHYEISPFEIFSRKRDTTLANLMSGNESSYNPISNTIFAVGTNPMIATYTMTSTLEGETPALTATRIATKVAAKVTTAVFGFAKSLFWVGSTSDANDTQKGDSQTKDGNESEDNDLEKEDEQMLHRDLSSANPLTSKCRLKDKQRHIAHVKLEGYTSRFAATADSLGRVLVIDIQSLVITRIFKGYREAQCAWLATSPTQTPPATQNPQQRTYTKRDLYLVIYAPRRGLLEVWNIANGKRAHAANIGAGYLLLQPTPPLVLQQQQQPIVSVVTPKEIPIAQCFLLNVVSGELRQIQLQSLLQQQNTFIGGGRMPAANSNNAIKLTAEAIEQMQRSSLSEVISLALSEDAFTETTLLRISQHSASANNWPPPPPTSDPSLTFTIGQMTSSTAYSISPSSSSAAAAVQSPINFQANETELFQRFVLDSYWIATQRRQRHQQQQISPEPTTTTTSQTDDFEDAACARLVGHLQMMSHPATMLSAVDSVIGANHNHPVLFYLALIEQAIPLAAERFDWLSAKKLFLSQTLLNNNNTNHQTQTGAGSGLVACYRYLHRFGNSSSDVDEDFLIWLRRMEESADFTMKMFTYRKSVLESFAALESIQSELLAAAAAAAPANQPIAQQLFDKNGNSLIGWQNVVRDTTVWSMAMQQPEPATEPETTPKRCSLADFFACFELVNVQQQPTKKQQQQQNQPQHVVRPRLPNRLSRIAAIVFDSLFPTPSTGLLLSGDSALRERLFHLLIECTTAAGFTTQSLQDILCEWTLCAPIATLASVPPLMLETILYRTVAHLLTPETTQSAAAAAAATTTVREQRSHSTNGFDRLFWHVKESALSRAANAMLLMSVCQSLLRNQNKRRTEIGQLVDQMTAATQQFLVLQSLCRSTLQTALLTANENLALSPISEQFQQQSSLFGFLFGGSSSGSGGSPTNRDVADDSQQRMTQFVKSTETTTSQILAILPRVTMHQLENSARPLYQLFALHNIYETELQRITAQQQQQSRPETTHTTTAIGRLTAAMMEKFRLANMKPQSQTTADKSHNENVIAFYCAIEYFRMNRFDVSLMWANKILHLHSRMACLLYLWDKLVSDWLLEYITEITQSSNLLLTNESETFQNIDSKLRFAREVLKAALNTGASTNPNSSAASKTQLEQNEYALNDGWFIPLATESEIDRGSFSPDWSIVRDDVWRRAMTSILIRRSLLTAARVQDVHSLITFLLLVLQNEQRKKLKAANQTSKALYIPLAHLFPQSTFTLLQTTPASQSNSPMSFGDQSKHRIDFILQLLNSSSGNESDSRNSAKELTETYTVCLLVAECLNVHRDVVRVEFIRLLLTNSENADDKAYEIALQIADRSKAGIEMLKVAKSRMAALLRLLSTDKRHLQLISLMPVQLYHWITSDISSLAPSAAASAPALAAGSRKQLKPKLVDSIFLLRLKALLDHCCKALSPERRSRDSQPMATGSGSGGSGTAVEYKRAIQMLEFANNQLSKGLFALLIASIR